MLLNLLIIFKIIFSKKYYNKLQILTSNKNTFKHNYSKQKEITNLFLRYKLQKDQSKMIRSFYERFI